MPYFLSLHRYPIFFGTFLRVRLLASNPSFRTVLACHYRPCRIRAVFHFPTRLYTDSVFQPGRTYAYGQSQYPYGNFPVGCFLSEYGHACGAGKYYRSDRSDCCRRPGGAFLDVGIRVFRYGDCLYGKYPGTDIQGEAGERICGRPSILCAVSLWEQVWIGVALVAGLYRVCHDVPCLHRALMSVVFRRSHWEAFFQEATIPVQSGFYYVVSLLSCTGHGHGFRGNRRIAAVSNKLVPVMAVIYVLTVVSLDSD